MNAVERLEAAIEKLEAMRKLDWPCASWTQQAVRHIARNCDIPCFEHETGEDFEPTWDRYATGPAIYALSQTIDAQLEGMRAAVRYMHVDEHDETFALALADAILGGA